MSTPHDAALAPAAAPRPPGWLGAALECVERGLAPDALIRFGVRRLCAAGIRARGRGGVAGELARERQLIAECARSPIAVRTDAANAQHYELPPEFFALCLGPRRKYSGCYWPQGVHTLDAAEEASLRATCEHADLHDGMDVLELGCGWGSLTLWMAERFPNCRITAVSNSHSQREHIEAELSRRQLTNVRVLTVDMNAFDTRDRFDRVVSVEMFEHMRNHRRLLERIAGWLRPEGRLFVHIFVHRRTSYLFESNGPGDWITQHFFAGGIMPSDHLLYAYPDHLVVEDHWRQDGRHYARTANAWLGNIDARRRDAMTILESIYGRRDAARWMQRWRVFFMACAEMFGCGGGQEWWVSHYRMRPR